MMKSAAAGMLMALAAPAAAQLPTLTDQQQNALTREIGDRVPAGKTNCIRQTPRLKLTVISDDVLVYRVGSKRYVSRTIGTCNKLTRGKPVIGLDKPRICAGDPIMAEDLESGIRTGSCAMGAFAIYDRPDKEDKDD